MKCNEGPRPHSRALCLHGVYLPWTQGSHPTATPPRFTPTHSHILRENCLIKLPQHVPQRKYSIKTAAGICTSTTAQEHVAPALQSHCIVCEIHQRSALAGLLIALVSSPALSVPLSPSCPHLASPAQPNEAFQSRDKVVKASYFPC